MKILHIISALASGGAEIFVKDLSIALKQNGHDVAIAYVDGAADQNLREQDSSASVEKQFKAELEAEGIPVFEIGRAMRRNPLRGGLRLRKIIKSFKPDILHIHLGLGILFYSFSFLRLPTIYTHHSIVFRFGKVMTWWFNRFVKTYVAICEKCRTMLHEKTAKPIVLVRNGISERRIAPPDSSRGTGAFKIISVGSIREAKDYPTTIAIAARVKEVLPNPDPPLQFLVYGDGKGIKELREMARQKSVDDILLFQDFHPDIPALLASADILLMSSIYEGLPISLIEAVHAGLPMIATDVGGCPEIVRHDKNGFIFQPKDVEAGAAYIRALYQNQQLRNRFSKQSHLIAHEFSMETSSKLHMELYRATLAGNTA